MRQLTLLALLFSFLISNFPAEARTKAVRNKHRYEQGLRLGTERYDKAVKRVYTSPDRFDANVASVRVLYPQSRDYEPFAKKIIDLMTERAYIVDTSNDNVEINTALGEYNHLVRKHLGNIEVVEYALTLSHNNVQFGNKHFFQKVYNALVKNVMAGQRDSFSPETSRKVMTYGEENYILGQIGGFVQKSEIYKVNNIYYNVHDIKTKEDENIQIFIDISIPIQRVLKRQEMSETSEKTTIHKR